MEGLRRTLKQHLPGMLIVAILAGGTAYMLMYGSDEESVPAGSPASAADPHPSAGSFVPDETELRDCDDQLCYEQAFGNLVYNEGAKAAFAVFDEEMAKGGAVEAGCHRIAHAMGGAGLTRNDGDVGQAFAEGSASCWSGYYHGVLEWALEDVPIDDLGSIARGLCEGVGEEASFLRYQCIHGLGHGMMITTGYELPQALGSCGELASQWDQDSCRGGVFMENIATGSNSPIKVTGEPRWLREDDLIYPCNDDEVTPEVAKYQCYVMVTTRILEHNGYDFPAAADWCRKAERDWVETCFESFGRDSSGFTTYDPGRTVAKCRITEEYMGRCIWAAARDYTLRHAGPEKTTELCAITPARLRSVCFSGIGTIIPTLHSDPAEQVRVCRQLHARYGNDCVQGLNYGGQPDPVRLNSS